MSNKPRASGRNAGLSILVDARGLYASGIGRYLREILIALFADARFQQITLLGDAKTLKPFVEGGHAAGRVRIYSYPDEFYSPRVQLAWGRLRQHSETGADVSFFPHYDAPLWLPRRSVVTVHDLTHFKVPEAFPAWKRTAAGILLQRAVSGADRVLTVSDATRRDLADRFPRATEKIEVVPNGVSPVFRPLTRGEEAACSSVAALCPFVLCVGNRKPHKNVRAAVEALALLRERDRELRLVLTGQIYPGWEEVLQTAASLGVAAAIVDLGRVSDAELRCLYACCEALVFPSLYEGFGLPVLEAMACGAPVVASDRASLPEVVGDAGLLIDPTDIPAIGAAVDRVRQPSFRANLVARGQKRAACFTWDRATARILAVLHAVATGESITGSRTEPIRSF